MPDERIVIIDDEPGIVSLCSRLLSRANFEVQGMSVPEEGLQLLRQEQFDLLLVDIRMPGMDGFAVIEQARTVQPDIAVVIMTGYGPLETAIRALRKGADGLILKPFESGQDLVRTVRDALQVRKEKQEVSRLRAIRPLLNVTELLFGETRFDPLLDLILDTICEHLQAENAMIYQRQAGDSFLNLLAGKGRAMPEEHARASGGIVARAEHWDVPLWANQGGPGDAAFQQVLQEHDYAGAICIPVQRGEGALVFAAARSSGQPAFHIADVEAFGLLARQADIALENSRLYEELREYVKQIQQSQLALIQAEKMSAVGRLTASIAHEVNNPLQAVQNCLHLSQRDELKIEKRTEYLQMADEELDRLMSTVQRMLDFYRPGALEKSETDLADLIGKVLALLEKQMQNQKIEVIQDIQPDLPEVLAVGNQIQQVFFNLVLNAMEAIEEDGIITITLRKEDSSVVAEIRDTGPGVDPGLQNTIFEPFVSSGVDGTGLGLSVSYGILTAHNGTLELVDDSKPGACFRVTLPLEVK